MATCSREPRVGDVKQMGVSVGPRVVNVQQMGVSVAPRVVADVATWAQRGAQVGVVDHAWVICATRMAVCVAPRVVCLKLGVCPEVMRGRYQPHVGEWRKRMCLRGCCVVQATRGQRRT